MRNKFLLGATKNNELAFGEFEITHRNGYAEFTASFHTVRPFNGENFDLKEYFEGMLDGWDNETKYDACVRADCKPSELVEYLADECDDVRDALDCSLYPECYTVDGDSWYFESSSFGQHDTRDEMEEIIYPEAYNLLHKLWDDYHSKRIDSDVESQVDKLFDMFDDCINEEAWIIDYIQRHMEDYE